MQKSALYTFVTSLLNEIQIDTTLFSTFLDVAQMRVEGIRPWVILRGQDNTQTASQGDTFLTSKNLATDFREWYDESPIQLVDSNNNPIGLVEVPFADRFQYRSSGGRFCVDYPNNKIYLLGNLTQSYTIYQNYIKVSTLVSTSDTTSWVFPERFHKILGLMIAEMWKNGIDYDVFTNSQATQQAGQAKAILDEMVRWDMRLQQNMTRGLDPFNQGTFNANNAGGLNGTNLT